MKKVVTPLLLVFLLFVWQIPLVSAAGEQLIIINKSNNQLIFYENNKAVKTFSVATGRSQGLTPEGKFKIVNKIVNRPYYKENIPGGDPRNPLGNRWLGLNARGTNGTTYAVHGNNNPDSIGKYVSSGCIRMHNEEVRWLFDKVKVNTPVIIVTSNKPFDNIAAANGYKVSGGNKAVPVSTSGVLKKGSRGEAVKVLQQQLTALGYNTKGIDGSFGPATEAALKKFQKDNKLKADGVAGSETRNLINQKHTELKKPASSSPAQSATLKQGSRGAAVTDLQKKLHKLGYNTKGIDGVYGPATKAAVQKFQKDNKLKADGIAGPQTLKILNSKQ